VKSPGANVVTVRRLIAPMAGLLLVLAAALIYVLVYSANSMDRSAVERQQAQMDNAFTLRLVQSLSELRSVAWWDEMVVKSRTRGFDGDWLDLEVGVFMTTSYGHDRILILDERGKPVYGFADDARIDPEVMTHYAGLVTPLVSQIRGGADASPRIDNKSLTDAVREDSELTDRSYGRGAAAVMSNDGKPVLASVMAITPSVDMSLKSARPRLLVSVIDLDADVLKTMGNSILMPDLSFQKAGDRRLGRFALRSDDGKPMGVLAWTPKQPGRDLIDQLLPLILIVLAATAAIIAYLFRRLMNSTRSLAEREVESRFLANHDALTGLPNRRQLERLYERQLEHDQQRGTRLAVACVDLDRFKDINDTLGHHAGDELIKAVSQRLRRMLNVGDTLARLGGDEFAILRIAPWGANLDDLCHLLDTCFEKPFEVTGHKIDTAASMGIYVADFEDSFDDAIRRADIALYDAKANGRGRASRFSEAMAKAVEERHSIETELKRAIGARELTLAYQPIVEAATGAVSSVEALVRWNSPVHGAVSPQLFVNIAEEAGLMADLGRFVIQQAIEDAQRWPELTTAINISPAQLRSATMFDDLLDPCRRYGVSPKRITIEITESVLMANDDRTLRVLKRLKNEGFTLALDDFGTGYSSLAYIRDFPFDRLKIDRSFVKGLTVSDRALAIVEGVVNFGRILGREIVAEGIETEQEMQAMQQAGCTHLQGFLFSRPLPADHVEALAATFGKLASPHRARPAAAGATTAKLVPLPQRKAN
jgi:diguanylate cyclase (GGDEF)-like protein